jgi:hypothetical protein
MTIETKFNLGDEVLWTTESYSGSGTVKDVDIHISEHGTRVVYRIHVKGSGIHLVFFEQDLFATREELIKHLQDVSHPLLQASKDCLMTAVENYKRNKRID